MFNSRPRALDLGVTNATGAVYRILDDSTKAMIVVIICKRAIERADNGTSAWAVVRDVLTERAHYLQLDADQVAKLWPIIGRAFVRGYLASFDDAAPATHETGQS